MATKLEAPKQVASRKHDEAKRPNIPTTEYEPMLAKAEKAPVKVA